MYSSKEVLKRLEECWLEQVKRNSEDLEVVRATVYTLVTMARLPANDQGAKMVPKHSTCPGLCPDSHDQAARCLTRLLDA